MAMINEADHEKKVRIFLRREILLFGSYDRIWLNVHQGVCTWCGLQVRHFTAYCNGKEINYTLCPDCEEAFRELISTASNKARDAVYGGIAQIHHAGLLWDIAKLIGVFCWRLTNIKWLAADILLE